MLKQWVVTAVLLIVPGGAFAGTTMGPDLSVQDRQFIETAASEDLAQIKLAQLALDKSQNPTVRTYAEGIVEDHKSAGRELRAIARGEKFPEPTSMDTGHQAQFDKLAKLSGKEFEVAYLKLMVKEHDHAIESFQKASSELSYPELKQYAKQTLPTLVAHQQHAKSNLDAVKKEK